MLLSKLFSFFATPATAEKTQMQSLCTDVELQAVLDKYSPLIDEDYCLEIASENPKAPEEYKWAMDDDLYRRNNYASHFSFGEDDI